MISERTRPQPRELEKALFDTALGLDDPGLRRRFLAQACQGDSALAARLEQLLAADALAGRFFDLNPHQAWPPASAQRPPPAAEAPPNPGAVAGPLAEAGMYIGRYRLLQRLGEGGCGIVYLAEQQEPVKRHVALKIIRLGMDTERVIARFEMERQALALMNHPHIAQVLDAGATDSGRPYFVMEWVPGVRITEHCDRHRLGTAARLELFLQVCLAIQHAHQKGILHRDIKPSNILVDPQDHGPVPKVIDFGIAKAVEDHPAGDATFTVCEPFIGTPAYMSPEQAEAGRPDVDTRSDIYGLGALLHELLTGRPPFDRERLLANGIEGMRRILREEEPPAPSDLLRSLPAAELAAIAGCRQAEPPRLLSALRGELDWIVLKALEKDPRRRYATVNDLAADLRRCLRHEPVEARPCGRLYRLRKLVRRNRLAFAAAAAVAAALVAGFGTSTWLYLREREILRRQTVLLDEAREAEKLTQAVFFAREGKFEDADRLLLEIKLPLTRPTFDGVVAFRMVGDWMATQRRWRDCADRYAALNQINRFDYIRQSTLDYQSYGVALLEAGDPEAFLRFEQELAAGFTTLGTRKDGEMNSRILKLCLLLPPDPALWRQLQPYAEKTETWFASLDARTPRFVTAWAAVPLSLWHYRQGDYPAAIRYVDQCLNGGRRAAALDATLQVILSLIASQTGHRDEARARLEEARKAIEAKFKGPGNGMEGYWFDWAFAHLLLREAEALAATPPEPAS